MSCLFAPLLVFGLPVMGGADIHLGNRLASGPSHIECVMDIGGVMVGVSWDSAPGNVPDTITIIPPAGYYADQPVVVLPEGADIVVAVRPILMG